MALQNVEANITLDLYNHDTTPATVKAIQLDSQTRYVAAMLQSMGAEYGLDSNATVQLIVIRPDKVGVQITGTTFTYGDEGAQFLGPYAELTQVALAINGKMRGQFKITSGNQILRTEIFAISTGEALDASTDEWADEYDGYNLEEMATSIEANTADIATLEADVSQIKEDFTDMVNSTYVTDFASGSIAHLTDGADNVLMKSVKVNIAPIQSGSGDPSPSNVRPITGYDSVKVYHSGADTADATEYDISLASAGTVYGGTLDVVSGVLTVDKGFVTLDGTQTIANRNWRATPNSVGWLYPYSVTQNVAPNSSTEVPDVISNRVKTASYSAAYNGTENNCVSLVYDTSKVYGLAVRCDNTLLTTDAAINAFLAENPIQVVYSLATPLTYQLTAQEITSLLGINNVWSDAGDMDVEYRADTKLYIKRLTGSDTDMIADANITSGQYFMVGNDLYRATVNIASGAQIVVGTNATKVSLSEALNQIKEA